MTVIFQNLAGAWALLGVPALVLIHCLRVRARVLRVPAVFLIEQREEVASGAKFARWRPSPLFWVQLLAVLLATLAIMAPRLVDNNSRRDVALVLDASASMAAYPEAARAAVARRADALSRDVASVSWLLMTTDEKAAPLYAGDDRAAMLAALAAYRPAAGAHDFSGALLAARRALGKGARVVLVTDHPPAEIPGGSEWTSVGAPFDNVGFSGATVDPRTRRWRAVVTNRGDAPAERAWTLTTPGGAPSAPATVSLAPNASVTLEGVAPADTFTLALTPDAFAFDDRATLVVPKPKTLLWRLQKPDAQSGLIAPVLRGLESARVANADESPDLVATFTRSREIATGAGARVLVWDGEGEKAAASGAPCYAPAPHPLTDGLSWGVTPALSGTGFVLTPDDLVLVRSGDRPLIALGRRDGREELLFNYDPRAALAGDRSPAAAVLLMRFAERVRAAKDAPETVLTDAGAPLVRPVGGALVVTDARGVERRVGPGETLRAPVEPGAFRVTVDGVEKVSGAALFADGREADFRAAARGESVSPSSVEEETRAGVSDPLTALLALGVLGALLVSWHLATTRAVV